MSELLTIGQVREATRATVAAMPGVARVDLDPGDETVLWVTMATTDGQDARLRIDIGNLYSSYRRRPGDLDAVINAFTSATIQRIAASIAAGSTESLIPASWEAASSSVYLRLDRAERLAGIAHTSGGLAVPLSRPWLAANLCVVVVYDTPRTMHHICQSDLAGWGVDAATVFDVAGRRLRVLTAAGPGFSKPRQLYQLVTGDGYAAARLLAPAELRAQLPEHLRDARLVVAAPRRDLLVMMPSHRADLAPLFVSTVMNNGEPYTLSPTMFTWEGDELTPIRPRAIAVPLA